MTSEEVMKRHRQLLLEEQREGKEQLWFISQVVVGKPETARACYIWARGSTHAISISKALGLHVPDSEMAISEMEYTPPPDKIGILMTREEVNATCRSMIEQIKKGQ